MAALSIIDREDEQQAGYQGAQKIVVLKGHGFLPLKKGEVWVNVAIGIPQGLKPAFILLVCGTTEEAAEKGKSQAKMGSETALRG